MSDLAEQLQQIREAVDSIDRILSYNKISDPSLLYLEPRVEESALRGGRMGPSIDLCCSKHDWFRILFPWGGGGRVYLAGLIEEIDKHLKASHG